MNLSLLEVSQSTYVIMVMIQFVRFANNANENSNIKIPLVGFSQFTSGQLAILTSQEETKSWVFFLAGLEKMTKQIKTQILKTNSYLTDKCVHFFAASDQGWRGVRKLYSHVCSQIYTCTCVKIIIIIIKFLGHCSSFMDL